MTRKQLQNKIFNKFNSITQRDKEIIDLVIELMQYEINVLKKEINRLKENR